MTKIIGLTGPAGSGKDTIADWLESTHGFERLALADPIRLGLQNMLDLSYTVFRPGIKEQVIPWLGRSPRELMQTLGTEWGRHMVRRDLWLRVAERTVAAAAAAQNPIVITDIRFEDEAAWLRGLGGAIWHVNRPGVAEVRGHVSEAGVACGERDVTIYNDGSIEYLFAVVDAVLRRE